MRDDDDDGDGGGGGGGGGGDGAWAKQAPAKKRSFHRVSIVWLE